MADKLRLRSRGGRLDAPILNGHVLDRVTRVQMIADPYGLPSVTIDITPDVVFNGKAWVTVKDIDIEVSVDARTEFANALNEADQRARRKARDAQRALDGLPTGRGRLPESTDAGMLVDEMEALGWGFYRTKKESK
jgi:hypothetical protein